MRLEFHNGLAIPPAPTYTSSLSGLGDAYRLPTTTQAMGAATGGISLGVQTAIVTGSKVAGGIAAGLLTAAPFAGPAAPFLVVAAGLVGPIAKMLQGCGQTCIDASNIADGTAEAVKKVNDAYWAQDVRYQSSQVAALITINNLLDNMYKLCSDPALGVAGQKCISERLIEGAPAPWCDHVGHVGCDYISMVVNPIRNDAGVVIDPPGSAGAAQVAAAQAGASGSGTGQSPSTPGSVDSILPYLLLGAGAVALLAVAD